MSRSSRPPKPPPPDGLPFPIVGVGASAGGLKAFQQLLSHLPRSPGAALVLIPHLDPAHESMMPEILAKSSKMPVREANQDTPVEVDHVYIIKPNTSISLSRGKLLTAEPLTTPGGGRECISHFLMSLAKEQRDRAIGVILSGTASDGATGIRSIKAEGGITFAQDDSAEFRGMPRAAVATGAVDYVLAPKEIARELVRIVKHPYFARASSQAPTREKDSSPFTSILKLLEKQSGVPFLSYKMPTLERRVARRMAIRQIEALETYLEYLEGNPQEVRDLHDEVLIHVTSFFREPATFEALKRLVFPALLEKRPAKAPIRVWVPGCSTGEEAYSFAISLVEYLDDLGSGVGVQIFASDVSEHALSKARDGIYPASIAADVSPERIRRFFTEPDSAHVQISKRLRDMVLFARQDLTQDPPFSRLDILSCRNVLIYFGSPLHRQVLPLFHYALQPDGFLVLGASESADRFADLFKPLDTKHRIYRKLAGPAYAPVSLPIEKHLSVQEGLKRAPMQAEPGSDIVREADRVLMGLYMPAAIVVSGSGQVIEVRGDVSRVLRFSPGKPDWHLQRLAHEELRADLETALKESREKGVPVLREGLEYRIDGQIRHVDVKVLPLDGAPAGENYFAMVFEQAETKLPKPVPSPKPLKPAPPSRPKDLERENGRLRRALATQQEYQQSIIEQLEGTNEELRSSHEEVLSANEELQSTNEEMQTAKEELQSSNEELMTLNDELRNRNTEQAQTNNDLHNVLTNIQVPMVIVDSMLRIRRITPLAEKMLNILPADLNRRITDFKPQVDIPNLEELLHTAIDRLSIITQEVRDRQGKWWQVRIRPYRTLENKIDGAVVTYLDVDELKRASIENEERRLFSDALVASMRDPFLVLDRNLKVKQANETFLRFFHLQQSEIDGKPFFGLENGQWNIPSLRQLLEEILPKNIVFNDLQVEREFPRIGRKVLLLHARQVQFTAADEPAILLTFEDATDRKENERRIRELNLGLERQVSERTSKLEGAKGELEAFTYSVAHDLRAPLRAMYGFGQCLLDDYVEKPIDQTGRGYIERIIQASRRMDTLILDLLDYSRLSREEVQVEPVDLGAVVKQVLADLTADIEARQAKVTIEGSLPRVIAHKTTVAQVMTNLISNALKFVAPGVPPQVKIRAERAGESERIWVEDNGIGVAKHHQDRVFRVFERLNKVEDYPGTGIGLAIVRKAMERVNGKAGFESQLGEGSQFWIEFQREQS